jgi:hypothetical protein
MSTDNNKDNIGALVRTRTSALQKTLSNLARRGMQDIDLLTADARVSELIRKMDGSSDFEEREEAWMELRKMGPTYRGWAESLSNLTYAGDGWSQIFSAEALSQFSCNLDDAVPVLIDTIGACLDRKDYEWGTLACGALANFKEFDFHAEALAFPVLKRVIEEIAYNNIAVSTDKINMMTYSIRVLGNYRNLAKSVLVILAPLLEHRDDPMWQMYFDTAQKIDPRAKSQVDALIVSLSSRDAYTRGEAVLLISKLGDAGISAIPELLSLVNDKSSDVRRFLAIAMGKLGQKTSEIVSVLNTLTHDPDDSVKVGAFYSLVCLRENQQSNLHRVLGFLSHNDPFVRHLTAWAVSEIGAIDKDNTISCLMRALRLEEHPRNKDLMAESIEKIRRC